jgi:hypothetical protein
VSTPNPDNPKPGRTSADKSAGPGGPWTSRINWQWAIAGVVILGVSLFLLVVQAGDPDANTGLFSGPTGMVMNIAGVAAGIWVLWRSYRR